MAACPGCHKREYCEIGVPLFPSFYRLPTGRYDVSNTEFTRRKLIQCKSCELRFFESYPTKRRVVDLYADTRVEGKWVGNARQLLLRDRLFSIMDTGQIEGVESILDVGSHTGQFLAAMPSDWRRVGVEENPVAVEIAERNTPAVEYLCSSFVEAPLEKESFDLITAFDLLEHLPDLGVAWERIYSLLRPGGWFIFETGNYSSLFGRFSGLAWSYYSILDHVVFLNIGSIHHLAVDRGFDTVKLEMTPHSYRVELASRDIAKARIKAALIAIYTAQGKIKWPHRILSNLLNRDGTIPPAYWEDHVFGALRRPV